MSLALKKDELDAYLGEVFAHVWSDFEIDALTPDGVSVRLLANPRHVRPGGTVSGPAMFALSDVAVYAAVLARVGRMALAVTTNCSIDFMRKPSVDRDLIADCRLLKMGRVLAVGDVLMFSDGDERPVARASLTYSIPPQGSNAALAG
ncbi:MAG: PaaI family thioesterase [Pseudomonadota bacterium]